MGDEYKLMPATFRGVNLLILLGAIIFLKCQPENRIQKIKNECLVEIENNSAFDRKDYLVQIDKSLLYVEGESSLPGNFVVFDGEREVASQNTEESLFFLVDRLAAGKGKTYAIRTGQLSGNFDKRTQAEISVKTGGHFENRKYIGGDFQNISYLRVPDEHTDHSYYIRYEGPGWESDLVGYRFYLDWRNATDVFGKKTSKMVLQKIGLDGFDSYHEMQDWGMDVLKVGSSLGVGTLGIYFDDHAKRVDETDSVTCEIEDNGIIYSAIHTKYYGWKVGDNAYDLDSRLSIHAGSRLSHHEVEINGQPEYLCTGIGKDTNAKLYTEQGNINSWGFLASYGKQSLNNDNLGLAVFFADKDYRGFTEDEFSHIVKLGTSNGHLDYYYLAVWEGENDGGKNEDDFIEYIKETAQKLAQPLSVHIKSLE